MRAYLDDAELPGPITSLAESIDAARQAAAARGRVVVEVSADGARVPDEVLDRPEAAPAPASVQFITAEPRSMVRVALLDAAEALERARDDHAAIVAALDGAEIDAARSSLERVLEAWGMCVATVRDGGALLGMDLDAPLDDGVSPSAHVGSLMAVLIEIKRCVGVQDWAGLGDAVGCDLEAQARSWDAMLRALADRARPAGASHDPG